MSLLRSRAKQRINICTSNPLSERLLARGGLNRCVLRFQSTALIQWKIEKKLSSPDGDDAVVLAQASYKCEEGYNFSLFKPYHPLASHFNSVNLPETCEIPTCVASPSIRMGDSSVHCNAPICSCSALGKRYDAQSQEKTHIFTPVMLNLFQHLTSLQYSFQAYEILNLSWIIRVLAGVTSRSNLRARLRRRPTENPQVQDDNLTKEGLLCFP